MLVPDDSKALVFVDHPQKQHGNCVNMSSTHWTFKDKKEKKIVLLEANTLFSLHLQEPCCFIENMIENKPHTISIPEYILY